MLNPAHLIATPWAMSWCISTAIYGDRQPDYASPARTAAKLVIERIANSDALYHDSHHTSWVTLVGQAIFKGRIVVEQTAQALAAFHRRPALPRHRVPARHLPGDFRRRLRDRRTGRQRAGAPRASDAFLTILERGKMFVRSRCAQIEYLDAERIARALELTRFPVPKDNDHAETDTEAGWCAPPT